MLNRPRTTTFLHPQYKRDYIVLADYIIYMDLLYNGTQDDRNKLTFMMLDIQIDGMVYKEEYKDFCFQFLSMYDELMQMNTKIDHRAEEIIEEDYEKLVRANGKPKTDQDGR